MQGIELIKNLAELDDELTQKVEETHRLVEQKIKDAEAEGQRLLAEAEAQIRQMEEASKSRIAEESENLAADAQARAQTEKKRIHDQAMPNIEQAVEFILIKVMP